VFPTLQRLAAEGRTGEMREVLARALKNVLVISFAAQVVLTACGDDVVALVYGRTRLDAQQVRDIGACLTLVSIGLAAWAAQAVIARGFYALGNTWLPALLGTVIAAAAYPLYVLGRIELGVDGLALSSTVAILVYTTFLAILLDRALSRESGARAPFVPFLARALGALAAGVIAGRAARALLSAPISTSGIALHAAVIATIGLLAFIVTARIVRLDEVNAPFAALRRRIARRAA
jgi:putative peptidoglycan lipid II flippase